MQMAIRMMTQMAIRMKSIATRAAWSSGWLSVDCVTQSVDRIAWSSVDYVIAWSSVDYVIAWLSPVASLVITCIDSCYSVKLTIPAVLPAVVQCFWSMSCRSRLKFSVRVRL
jgi:hypothetical protein